MADKDSDHPPLACYRLTLRDSAASSTTHAPCGHCGKWDILDSTPLKRCTGCGVALYCDKDCQRAAWAEHRIFCRTKSTATTDFDLKREELGYATPLSLACAVKEWAEVHSYTLTAITHIALYTHGGGVDHNLATPRAMLFILESVADIHDPDHRGHVSKAFRIVNARIAHKDDLPFLGCQWTEDRVADRQRILALLRETTPNSALAGLFPVTFMVRGTGCVIHSHHEVHRPLRHPDGASPDLLTRLAFNDLDLLCRCAVALGIVFKAPEDGSQTYPEAGVYSRAGRKRWKKKPRASVWEDMLEPMVTQHASEFFLGLPLKLIWAMFENW